MADESRRSAELDAVRRLLFPRLPEEAGWAKIDAALEGAADEGRLDAIDAIARSSLVDDLLTRLRQPGRSGER